MRISCFKKNRFFAAAMYYQAAAADIRGQRRGHKYAGIANIFRCCQTIQRDGRFHCRNALVVSVMQVCLFGSDHATGYPDHANFWSPFHRQRFGEIEQIGGLLLSWFANSPVGPSIVLLAGIFFLNAMVINNMREHFFNSQSGKHV